MKWDTVLKILATQQNQIENIKRLKGPLVFLTLVNLSILSVSFACGQPLSKVTVEDIQNLQNQIDAHSYQLALGNDKMEILGQSAATLFKLVDQQTEMLNVMAENVTLGLAIVEIMEYAITEMEKRVWNASDRLEVLQENVILIEILGLDLAKQIDGFNGQLNQLNSTCRHLHQVNQLWKQNFRIINSTFNNIKRKVNYSSPGVTSTNTDYY